MLESHDLLVIELSAFTNGMFQAGLASLPVI